MRNIDQGNRQKGAPSPSASADTAGDDMGLRARQPLPRGVHAIFGTIYDAMVPRIAKRYRKKQALLPHPVVLQTEHALSELREASHRMDAARAQLAAAYENHRRNGSGATDAP